MSAYAYWYWGLSLASDLALPELEMYQADADPAPADIVIRVSGEKAAGPLPEPRVTRDEVSFSVPGVARYWARAGREIVAQPEPGAEARAVRLFLLGSAWGALCYQRGLLAIHASVVQLGAGAVAFCGVTGAGKSSLAAWLVRQGRTLISDDLCRFDLPPSGPPRVWPGLPRLKLWQTALAALGQTSDGLERDLLREDKYHLPSALEAQAGTWPVRAVCLLEWGAEPQLTRLTGAAAVRRFVALGAYRGEWLEPMGRLAAYWEQCAEVARRVPVLQLRRPAAWSAMPQTLALLSEVLD